MRVAVMQVGVVRVLVLQGLVPVPVGVRLVRCFAGGVGVAVVCVVDVAVLVLQGLVEVLMLVPFGQMQPQRPTPIRAPASRRRADSGSPRNRTASTAPMNGASAK